MWHLLRVRLHGKQNHAPVAVAAALMPNALLSCCPGTVVVRRTKGELIDPSPGTTKPPLLTVLLYAPTQCMQHRTLASGRAAAADMFKCLHKQASI